MTNLLALDIATTTGWAMKGACGTWDLRPKRDESAGMRLLRLRSKMKEMTEQHGANLVVYERVAGRFQSATNIASELVSVVKVFCEDHEIDYRAYSATEIKRFATGKGNCNKQKMIEAAKEKYDYKGKDDNEADALHLYHLAMEDLGL